MLLTSNEITNALLNGKSVYRLTWQTDPNNKIIIYRWNNFASLAREDHYSISAYTPSFDDIIADDWTVGEEPKLFI